MATVRFGMKGVVTSILAEEEAEISRDLFRRNFGFDVGVGMPAYNVRSEGQP